MAWLLFCIGLSLCFSAYRPAPLEDAEAKSIIKIWVITKAKINTDCNQQTAEALDATLAKFMVLTRLFEEWKKENKEQYRVALKAAQAKYCYGNAEDLHALSTVPPPKPFKFDFSHILTFLFVLLISSILFLVWLAATFFSDDRPNNFGLIVFLIAPTVLIVSSFLIALAIAYFDR